MNVIYIYIFFIGYALGCLQFAYFIGKINGIDIREHGSKNAGTTNITRILGKKSGAIVLLFDVSKTIIAILIANYIYFGYISISYSSIYPTILAGFSVVLGHCFPFYLKFRGGKGIASTLGLIIMLDWRIAVISIIVSLIALIASRYIAVASLVGLLAFAISTAFFYPYLNIIIVAFLLVIVCIFLHRSNIKRILNKTEMQIFSKKIQ